MTPYIKGDPIWYHASVRGAYGHDGQWHIPAVFTSMSKTGKRVKIEIEVVSPSGRPYRDWIYVKPTTIWRRETAVDSPKAF